MAATKPKRFYPPTPEQFIKARRCACLKSDDVASMLHVTLKTVKNWESGRSVIPYSAFKLLRLHSGIDLPGEKWEGWCFRSGSLWSPANRRFDAYELTYIGNMFSMARIWIAERARIRVAPVIRRNNLRLIVGGKG